MDIRRVFAVPEIGTAPDVALLLLRLVGGSAMMLHGWGKIQNPFGWMGENAFAPSFFQALAALSEFGGGLAWILGFLVPLASMGIASTMAVAVSMHIFMRGDPFVAHGASSYEVAALYLCVALVIGAVGPGRLSVDRLVFGRRDR